MKWNWKLPSGAQWRSWLKQYRLVLVLAAVGLVLVAWPTRSSSTRTPESQTRQREESFSVEELEQRLSQAISRIQGAGDATVLLSLDQGVERVLAQDQTEEQGESGSSWEQTTVICDGEDGEDVVQLTQYYPSFRGALVVCPGGDDPQVRLAVTQAVSALTGLGSDRITICAGD